jgi:hypothetical protein
MQAHSTNAAVKIPAYIEALEITLALRWKICIDQSFLFLPAGSTGSIRNESRRLAAIFFETANYSSSEAFANGLLRAARKIFLILCCTRSSSAAPGTWKRQKTIFRSSDAQRATKLISADA